MTKGKEQAAASPKVQAWSNVRFGAATLNHFGYMLTESTYIWGHKAVSWRTRHLVGGLRKLHKVEDCWSTWRHTEPKVCPNGEMWTSVDAKPNKRPSVRSQLDTDFANNPGLCRKGRNSPRITSYKWQAHWSGSCCHHYIAHCTIVHTWSATTESRFQVQWLPQTVNYLSDLWGRGIFLLNFPLNLPICVLQVRTNAHLGLICWFRCSTSLRTQMPRLIQATINIMDASRALHNCIEYSSTRKYARYVREL